MHGTIFQVDITLTTVHNQIVTPTADRFAIGTKWGHLTVLECPTHDEHSNAFVRCRCSCGHIGEHNVTTLPIHSSRHIAHRDAAKTLREVDKARIASEYADGKSSTSLAAEWCVSYHTILGIVRQHDVDVRDKWHRRRIYKIDDHAFSETTPDAAYWLGFLMADGTTDGRSMVAITLQRRDMEHLRKFLRFVKSEKRPIYEVPSVKAVQVKVRSRQIAIDIGRHGVVRRKTYCATASPEMVMRPEFWLGELDGDGSISRTHGLPLVDMVGTEKLMNQFASFVESKIPGRTIVFRPSVRRIGHHLYAASISGQRAANFLSLAYAKSPTYLDRKKAKASEMLRRVL